MNKGISPENLESLFMEYSQEYIDATCAVEMCYEDTTLDLSKKFEKLANLDQVKDKKLQKVDSVLDLYIDLGYLGVENGK